MEKLHILLLTTGTIGETLERGLRRQGAVWAMGIEVDAMKQTS